MSLEHRLHAGCCAAGAAGSFTLPGTQRQYERSRPFLIRHLMLDLKLDIEARAVSGTARLTIERVNLEERELLLDAIGFELFQLQLDYGQGPTAPKYHYDGDQLRVDIPTRAKQITLEIEYRAQPRRGLYFIQGSTGAVEQVWSQCQDEDARHWFPCHDKPNVKMTTELRVRVPHGLTAISNGEMVESSTPKATKQHWSFHYRMEQPHPSYLVTLVVGRFAAVRDRDAVVNGRSIPVWYYVPTDRRADTERSLGRTPRLIEYFSELLGVPYPFSRYSQIVVSDFVFGGMENTTATTLYEHVLLDERAALDITSADLVAHELAHQWFGDLVTCRDWSHGWLNEGFATLFEHLEREERLGRDEYEQGIAQDVETYLSEVSRSYARAIVCRDYSAPIELFDRHLYEKGGLVLHMLRRKLGDKVFWEGVRRYLSSHAGGVAETTDLARSLEGVSGLSLERFFDEWVYRPGHPVLDVKVSWEHGQLLVSVKQVPKAGEVPLFEIDVEIEVGTKSNRPQRARRRMLSQSDVLVMDLPERPLYVAFDPEFRIVGNIKFSAPGDMLREQLKRASSARLRCEAARALGERDDSPTVKALGEALASKTESWIVRSECAASLGRIRGEECFSWLERQVTTDHPKVRRSVASALGEFRTEEAVKSLTPLARKDPSYLVAAEAARALGRTRQRSSLRILLSLLKQESWADVWRSGVLEGLGALREPESIERIREHTLVGLPSRGRRAAIQALAKLGDDRQTRRHLEDLLDDADPQIRTAAASALSVIGDHRSRAALGARLDRELDGRVTRRIREVLRELDRTELSQRRRISDELETLKTDFAELKVRLAKVEGQKKKGSRHED